MARKISARDHSFASGSVFLRVGGFLSALKATYNISDAWVLFNIWRQFDNGARLAEKVRLGLTARLINRAGRDAARIGVDTVIRGILRVERGASLEIGELCYIGDDVIISVEKEVRIGAGTLLGHGVQIFDNDTHPVDAEQRRAHFKKLLGYPPPVPYRVASAPVHIGESCWLGMNSMVMKGVTIGNRSIVAAGSVVTKSMPENVLIAGNPAKVIKGLS